MQRRAVTPLLQIGAVVCGGPWVAARGTRSRCVLALWLVCFCGGWLGLAQTAVDGAVSGKVPITAGPAAGSTGVAGLSGARNNDVRRAASLRKVRLVQLDPGGFEDIVHSYPVTADGRFLALRVAPGTYRVDEVLAGAVIATAEVQVRVGESSEVVLGPVIAGASGVPARRAPDVSEEGITEDVAARLATEAVVVPDETVPNAASDDDAERQTRGPERTVSDTSVDRGAGALLSFAGLAPTQNRTLLDGVSGDQAFRGGARGGAPGGTRAAASAYGGQSVAVRAGAQGFSAQYGGGGGLIVDTTARGDGRLHGGAAYTVQPSALAATNPFAVVTHFRDGTISSAMAKPNDLQQTFSGHVGGLAMGTWVPQRVRGRVGAYASVEESVRHFPAEASPATANFYALTANQTALLANRGVSTAQEIAALNYLDSLTGTVARSANRGAQLLRLDGRVGERDTVTASYARSRLSAPAGSGAGAATVVVARGRASVGDETVRADAVVGRWLHVFSGSATNEVRAQYARDLEFQSARAPLTQEPAISPGGFAPQVSIYDGSGAGAAFVYGTPAGLGRRAYPDERRVELADVAQVAAGRHVLTLGGDWSRVAERIDELNDEDGSYTYDTVATGATGLVDWMTDYTFNVQGTPRGGCPQITAAVHDFCFRSYAQGFGQSAVAFDLHEFAGFAEDVWRVRDGLTVELGARYEYVLLPLPQQPNAALNALFGGQGSTASFPEDRNNVGPRVGLGWSPRRRGGEAGRWGTVRLGYGVYAGRLPGTTVRAALVDTALPSSATHVRITPGTVTECPQTAGTGIVRGFGFECAFAPGAAPAVVAATTSAAVLGRGFRLPTVQAAELTFARGFFAGSSRGVELRATYSGAWATQLPKSTDLNIAPSTGLRRFVLKGGDGRVGSQDGEAFSVPVYTARVSGQFGAVTEVESNANATWHALTVEARARLPGGVSARGSWTWSKAIDYGAEQGAVPERDGQFDPFDVRYDKGLADANVPQRFAGDVVWATRLRRGPEWVRSAAGGWQLAALGAAQSGRAYTYQVFGGTHLSGGGYSLNGSGGSAYLPTVGRNTLRMPVRWRVDARLARGFRLAERLRGEGFAEAANVTNHVSASRVNQRAYVVGAAVNGVVPLVFQSASEVLAEGLNTVPFGAVTSSTLGGEGERRVRLGVRLEF